tara:strand:+ start:2215 stop:2358 length:144 start_codon:yes stop_codon:yes gene_type:complete
MAWDLKIDDDNNNNYNNKIDNKVTILIILWVLDKIAMALMFLFFNKC